MNPGYSLNPNSSRIDHPPFYDNSDVPKPERPIVVGDTVHSRQPTTDRNKLVDIIQALAEKTINVLEKDRIERKRHALRLTISNRIVLENDPPQSAANTNTRDYFEVKLPLDSNSWNEFELEDLQVLMLQTVVSIPHTYRWYKVRAHISFFMDEYAKTLLDEMNSDDEGAQGIISIPTVDESSRSTNQCNNDKDKDMDVDDEDDIFIVFDSRPKA